MKQGPLLSPRKSKRVRRNNSPTALQRSGKRVRARIRRNKGPSAAGCCEDFAVRQQGASDRKVRVTVATVAGCVCEIVNLVTSYDRSGPKYACQHGKRGFDVILARWESNCFTPDQRSLWIQFWQGSRSVRHPLVALNE